MSGAVSLRAPARASVVARHYLGMLGRGTALKGIGLAVAASLWTSTNTVEGFAATEAWLPLMAFLPLLQWRGGGNDAGAALPLGGVRHDLVRVACGLAWAAATLVLPAALWALGARLSSYPWWHPLLMLAAGLGYYLLGSAVWLRVVRPGRVLVILLLLVPALWEALGVGPTAWTVVYASRVELYGMGAAQWIASAAAWLGTGCAAVGLAAVAGRRGGHGERAARAARSASPPAPGGAARRTPRGVPGLPPRPASALTALRAQAALMRHRMAWPTVITLLMAWTDARAELRLPPGAEGPLFLHGASSLAGMGVAAFLWPLVVWMDDGGPGREHEEALPVGVVTRRLARVAAGGAWLVALCLVSVAGPAAGAWIAGTLPSPASLPAWVWAGVPAAVLMMYLWGSLPLLLSAERPLRRVLSWHLVTFFLVLPLLWNSGVHDARFSPTTALSVFTGQPAPWGGDAALFWLAVLAAAAACAAAVGASQDRGWPWPWSADPAGRAA